MNNYKGLAALAVTIIAVFIIISLLPWVTVDTGNRGVVLKFGAYTGEVLEPGFHFLTPFRDRVVEIDVQTQKGETGVAAASKDLQSVTTTVALNFRLDPARVGDLYQKIGVDYSNRIIAPAIQEAVKAVTAKFTAEELITRRQEVKEQTKLLLVERLAKDNIIVEDLSIVNFDFSRSFNDAIEAKVTAEQQALAAKNKLEQVKFEAQQQIETAKAEAESIKIQAAAVNAQGGADYVKLQAISKWNGVLPQTMLPNASVPFLSVQ